MWMEQICVYPFKPVTSRAFLLLSGWAMAVQSLEILWKGYFKTTSEPPEKPLEREMGRERTHLGYIVSLKKKKIYEKDLKSLKKAFFVIMLFLYHFVIILSVTFLIWTFLCMSKLTNLCIHIYWMHSFYMELFKASEKKNKDLSC